MQSANEKQVGGTHYAGKTQHWDYVARALRGRYFEGNITKYVARHRKKNGLQDLEKALHYLDKLTEMFLNGTVRPPRESGEVMYPEGVSAFVEDSGLEYWEAQVMLRAALWNSAVDLGELKGIITVLKTRFENSRLDVQTQNDGSDGVGQGQPALGLLDSLKTA
jgi:hypothetical protein